MKKILFFILSFVLLQSALFAQQAPDFTETDCNGIEHHLYGELAAGNAVIINFCAGWCGPCRAADPKLEEIYQQYCQGTGNVKVYGMLFEANHRGEITDCAFGLQYAEDYGLTFPLITDIGTWYPASGLTGEYDDALGLFAIPTFYVIIPNMADPANSTVHTIVGNGPTLKEDLLTVLSENGFGPSISFSGDLCTNDPSATLTSNYATGNLWSTGETDQSITVSASGTYTLTHIVDDCEVSVSKDIEFLPLPVAGTASTSSNTVCSGGIITLDYTSGDSDEAYWLYLVQGDPNVYVLGPASYGPVPLDFTGVPPGLVVNFAVIAFNGSNNDPSCFAYSNEFQVTVNDELPGVAEGTASSSDNPVCLGSDDYTLNYSGNEPGAVWQVYSADEDIWFDYAYADQGPVPGFPFWQGSFVNGELGMVYRVRVNTATCYSLSNEVEVEYLTSFNVDLSITPENDTYTGDVPTNIYLGYGPQSVTLEATPECSNFIYQYWDGPFLSCNDCDNPVFAPTEPGDYEIMLYLIDEYGQWVLGVGPINFCVRDVSVPGQNEKVYVCHNNTSLAVNEMAVPSHLLNHQGDALGECGEGCAPAARSAIFTDQSHSHDAIESGMRVAPNPAQDEITVSFHAETEASYTFKIINATGQTMASGRKDAVQGDNEYQLSMKDLPSGMYFVVLQSGETVMQEMIIKD